MNRLAVSYFNLGQYQDAMHLEKQTLELRKRKLGHEHPDTLQKMGRLSVYYSKVGQYQETMRLGRQAVEAQRRILGPAHPDTINSVHNLARISQHDQGSQ